ncbi:MBL fold metallo-hydrolase [Streptomyces sp. NPDC001904]|uniref:MBL fold metallo-hydrolase n=1 Tax=Streptomyces sp. NPDC001904 TaxID=3154531 RepID=UPI00331B3A76
MGTGHHADGKPVPQFVLTAAEEGPHERLLMPVLVSGQDDGGAGSGVIVKAGRIGHGKGLPICRTCGVQYEAPRPDCPVCLDERQYVGWEGQQWTTLARLRADGHRGRLDVERPGVIGVGAVPSVAVDQRALLIRSPSGNVLWDCVGYLDDDLAHEVEELGGISAIAVSHPHFYGVMTEWGRAFDAPVYIHEADREWVGRPDPLIKYWAGDTHPIAPGMTLINAGTHFAGGTVLHWADDPEGRGALFSGDIFMVVMDRRWVSFMYSIPDFIPGGTVAAGE